MEETDKCHKSSKSAHRESGGSKLIPGTSPVLTTQSCPKEARQAMYLGVSKTTLEIQNILFQELYLWYFVFCFSVSFFSGSCKRLQLQAQLITYIHKSCPLLCQLSDRS